MVCDRTRSYCSWKSAEVPRSESTGAGEVGEVLIPGRATRSGGRSRLLADADASAVHPQRHVEERQLLQGFRGWMDNLAVTVESKRTYL